MGIWESTKKFAKTVVKKIINTVKKGGKITKDILHRFMSVLDWFGSWLGIKPKKYLRIKVYILKRDGIPVQKLEHVRTWVEEVIDIYRDKPNVEVRPANLLRDYVEIMDEDSPEFALNAPPFSSGGNYFSDAADYFEGRLTHLRTSSISFLWDWIGYGEPIYAFVVDSIQDDSFGQVYGWGANYCLISSNAELTTLSHEIGHVCGLFHSNSSKNLMKPSYDVGDRKLKRSQCAWIRSARFVVYLPRRG